MERSPYRPSPDRYRQLDELNHSSWYMTDPNAPFIVVQSVARTAGETPAVLGGNMSPVRNPDGSVPYGPRDLDDDARYKDAEDNMRMFLEQANIDPADIRMLNAERNYSSPLGVVNLDLDTNNPKDDALIRYAESGDFIYSFNPNVLFGVQPADCPIAIMSAETPHGRINMMVHYAWRGMAAGQFEQMIVAMEALGVSMETLRIYITAGAQAETYRFTDYLPDDGTKDPAPVDDITFPGLQETMGDDGLTRYTFSIDTPYALYQKFISYGILPQQLFIDTTDTTSEGVGYSSHSRAVNNDEDETRDLVIACFQPR